MDCPKSRDEISAKTAQKFVVINASESPNLHSSSNSTEVSTNSTDNLSYSPHDHLDEVIFQNTLSDDDEHGSVDCIYAYRGAGADRDEEQILNNANENDDETDFLEMDFDPDPPSEIEQNFISCNNTGFDQQELFQKEILLMNEQLLKSVEKFSTNCNSVKIENEKSIPVLNKEDVAEELLLNSTAKNEDTDELSKEAKFAGTGAKPKKTLENKLVNGNINHKNKRQQSQAQKSYEFSAIEKLKTKHKGVSNNSTTIKDSDQSYINDFNELNDDICLDCLEKEFLSKIIGKDNEPITLCNKCKLNQNRSLKTFCESSIVNINNNNINLQSLEGYSRIESLDLNSFSVQNNRTDIHLSELNENSKITICDNINAEPILGSIKISSINYDVSTLIQALTKLNIKFDEGIIYKYLDRQKTDFRNICDFILYYSKRNCNYKKLIKVIKLVCKDKIKVEFQFDDTKINEFVQIRVYDILHYWQINNDLAGVKKLDGRFKQMNVLGKLVNKIRQAQQRVSKQQLNDFITIPQYYRSGYITITKVEQNIL